MSLNPRQMKNTAAELQRNLELSGLSVADLADRAGLSTAETESILHLRRGIDPTQVWLLRDKVETAVRETGREPVPFSVLTDAARERAAGWFGVTDQH